MAWWPSAREHLAPALLTGKDGAWVVQCFAKYDRVALEQLAAGSPLRAVPRVAKCSQFDGRRQSLRTLRLLAILYGFNHGDG